MRSCLSAEAIARLIHEDVPYFDLTTLGLGIGQQTGTLAFYTRHPTVVCGTEEAAQVLETCGAEVTEVVASSTELAAHRLILQATGNAEALHIGWRIALNLMEYSSGIATRTAEFVQAVHAISPKTAVVTTRKVFPGTRAMMMKAIVAGGALPHRLGLSETLLVFPQHTVFLGGFSGLLERLAAFRQRFQEHKVTVEVDTVEDAWKLAAVGIDIIQLDKVPLPQLTEFVPALRQRYPTVQLAAAGGITRENVEAYAALELDLLVTSALYFGKPADIAAKMHPQST